MWLHNGYYQTLPVDSGARGLLRDSLESVLVGAGGTGDGLRRWVKESLPLSHTEGKGVLKICGRGYKVSFVK